MDSLLVAGIKDNARRPTIERLRGAIARQREIVLDLDVAVDDCRLAIDHAVLDFQHAVSTRDRASNYLALLVSMSDYR